MAGHRRDEQSVHRPLSGLEKIGRLGRVEPTPPGGDCELVMKRGAEAQEPLHGLAEREPERCGDATVIRRRRRRFL
jgi:hypothetical protein